MLGKLCIALLLIVGDNLACCRADDCYVCYSHNDGSCVDGRDGFSGNQKVVCGTMNDTDYKYGCSKAKATGKILGFDFESVNRSCGQIYNNEHCKEFARWEWPLISDAKSWQCSCEGDYCNGAGVTTPYMFLMAMAFIGVVAWKGF